MHFRYIHQCSFLCTSSPLPFITFIILNTQEEKTHDEIVKNMCREISNEIKSLCSMSSLLTAANQDVKAFPWENILSVVQKNAPCLTSLLEAIYDGKKESHANIVTVAIAVCCIHDGHV